MKKNLTKILAISVIALVATACGPRTPSSSSSSSSSSAGPEEVAFGEILDLDNEGNWALEGQRVVVKGLAVGGAYGNTIIGSGATGETVGTLVGFEIRPTTMPTFTETSGRFSAYGYGAEIDVEATVTDVNGRVVLADADVTVVSERHYTSSGYTGGAPISWWDGVTRAGFDSVLGRKMSGVLIGATLQLASVPTFVDGQAADFYAVYPGEDLDLEDAENLSPLHVNIPAGVADASLNVLKDYFADKKVGDFVYLNALTQYDLVENGGMGLLVETFWSNQIADPDETPAVYSTWADLAAVIQPLYKDTVLDLTTPDAISYTVDESSFEYVASSFFKEEFCANFTVDVDKAVVADFAINVKASKIEESFAALQASVVEQGATVVVEGDGIAIYEVKNSADEVVANILLQNAETYIDGYYLALTPVETFTTWADAAEFYTGRATLVERTLNAEAAERTTALPAPTYLTPVSVSVNYAAETEYLKYYSAYGLMLQYTLEVAFPLYGDGEDDYGAWDAYETQLATAGFVYRSFTLFEADGYFNATTNEFVAVSVEDGVLSIDVLVLDAKSAGAIAERTSELYISYIAGNIGMYNSVYEDLFPTAATFAANFFTDFDVEGAVADDWGYANFGLMSQIRALVFGIDVYYESGDVTEIAAALNAELVALGSYTAGSFAALQLEGYVYSAGQLFVSVYADTEYNCVSVLVVVGPGVTAPTTAE